MKAIVLVLGVLSFTVNAAPKTTSKPAKDRCGEFSRAVASGTNSQKLKKYFDAQWKYYMTEYPEFATYVGYPGQNARWSDRSLEAVARRRAEVNCQLQSLKKIPRNSLKGEDRVNYDLVLRDLNMSIERNKFDDDYMPVNHMESFFADGVDLIQAMPKSEPKDFEDILKRLEGYPLLATQTQSLMREGLKRKVTPVKAFLGKLNPQIDALTTEKVEDSPLYQAFEEMPASVPADDQAKFRARAKEIISAKIYPSLKEFRSFLNSEYIPNAREFTAFSEMPNGKAWYAFLVKHHTTTSKTAEQIHETGLKEVERISAEMNKIREQVKFKGDLRAFNKHLLSEKKFVFKSGAEVISAYRDILKRIDAELPKMFRKLPRTPYGVREIAPFRAATSAMGQYIPGSLEGGRAGFFEANISDLPSHQKWQMETLAFHEAVPGHHLQIAIAQELEGLPDFRRFGGYTAFSEGWALYAESLGDEMGFYKDPYSKYGNLSDEMLRAVRLVVDTGMHIKGWSKQQALEFYRNNVAATDLESESEIDRYITWPGQALAYKTGSLKIRELRERTKAALGENFNVRDFHDEILGHGALPLDVLEKTVDEWIDGRKKAIKKSKPTST